MIRLSLRNKMLAGLLLLLAPVLVLLLLSYQDSLAQRRQVTLDDQLLIAQAVAVQVDSTFEAAVGLGFAVAADPLVQTMNPSDLDPHLTALVAANPVYEGIHVFDAAGDNQGWGSLTQPAEPRVNIADRAAFQQAMATNKPAVSDVLDLRRPNVLGVVAMVPIRGISGQPIGVVSVVMLTDQLAARFARLSLQPGQTIFLVDRQGRLAFDTDRPNLNSAQAGVFAGFAPVKQALGGQPVTVPEFTSPVSGERRLGAFVPTPDYGWAVGVTAPSDVALAPAAQTFQGQMTGFALILAFSVILAILLARLLTAPLARLREDARALGEGDLTHRSNVRTGDELEDLGKAFNAMGERVEQRQEEIRRLGAEAEKRALQLAAVIASMGDSVLVANAEAIVVEANPAALRLLGATGSDVVDRPLAELEQRVRLRHPDGTPLSAAQSPWRRALAGEKFTGSEVVLRDATGTEHTLSVSGAPVIEASGKLVLGVSVAHDVTAERRREQENIAVASVARGLVNEVELEKVAATVLDQGLRVTGADAVSLWLAEDNGLWLVLLSQRNLSDSMVASEKRLSLDSPLVTALAARTQTIQAIENVEPLSLPEARELYTREGMRSVLAVPLISRGRLVGVVSYFSRQQRRFTPLDLEFNSTLGDMFAVAIENANLYHELREAVRVRDEFMSAAAHELRTPVTTIKGWAEILSRANNRNDKEKRALAIIDTQTERITSLLNDLLAVVRLRPGPPVLERVRFDLAALARDVSQRLDATTELHDVSFDSSGPLPVVADMGLISDVLGHLLENAVRYSPSGGPVEVKAEERDREAIVSVHDYGVGIESERQEHVFEPFYEPVPAGVPGYLGIVSLGLHLSKQIVEAHGGRIWFVSEPGQGSIFYFSLPLAKRTR